MRIVRNTARKWYKSIIHLVFSYDMMKNLAGISTWGPGAVDLIGLVQIIVAILPGPDQNLDKISLAVLTIIICSAFWTKRFSIPEDEEFDFYDDESGIEYFYVGQMKKKYAWGKGMLYREDELDQDKQRLVYIGGFYKNHFHGKGTYYYRN